MKHSKAGHAELTLPFVPLQDVQVAMQDPAWTGKMSRILGTWFAAAWSRFRSSTDNLTQETLGCLLPLECAPKLTRLRS